jgi:hypothetical protein
LVAIFSGSEGISFIELNNIVAANYEESSADKVNPFFPADHTNIDGAKLNAEIVVNELKEVKPRLSQRT